MCFTIAASVVLFPEPVMPVTSTKPRWSWQICSTAALCPSTASSGCDEGYGERPPRALRDNNEHCQESVRRLPLVARNPAPFLFETRTLVFSQNSENHVPARI